MSAVYLDTPIAIWLHDGLVDKLTSSAKREIENNELLISPMAYIELDSQFRKGRVGMDAATIYANLTGTFGVLLCQFPFPAIALKAIECRWTDNPFDRIITAHAWANQESKLITPDETIRKHYHRAVW